MKNVAAISTGPLTHLDHLAPLCAILEIPLIVTEYDQLEIGQTFYPMVEWEHLSLAELTLDYMATRFEAIVVCGKFWAMSLKPLMQLLYQKELRVIFSPHGQSDKESFLKERVAQDIDLAYGPLMLQEKPGSIEMGNVRLWLYNQHKAHFDALAERLIFSHLDPGKKTVLYAPTWSTTATTTSFFEQTGQIVDAYSEHYNLVIKPHPLLEQNQPAHHWRIVEQNKEKAFFLHDFPAIYPLLEKSDIYLGDTSSIGYDFLYYNRPLFFLKEGGRLQTCGQYLAECTSIEYEQIELKNRREELYREAFGKGCQLAGLKKQIEAFLQGKKASLIQ